MMWNALQNITCLFARAIEAWPTKENTEKSKFSTQRCGIRACAVLFKRTIEFTFVASVDPLIVNTSLTGEVRLAKKNKKKVDFIVIWIALLSAHF